MTPRSFQVFARDSQSDREFTFSYAIPTTTIIVVVVIIIISNSS